MHNNVKIAVAGTGYVGMSLAVLLAQHNEVTAVDVVPDRIDMINLGMSPIVDGEISEFLASGKLNLRATLDAKKAYSEAHFVVIAVPTNYDEETGHFDTHHIEDVVQLVLSVNPDATMVIKSTIPIGYTAKLRMQYQKVLGRKPGILFAPEFLREGRALYDNLYPSRIIVGYDHSDDRLREDALIFSNLIRQGARGDAIPVLGMGSDEAEAVKLFANSYLAMRVAFFNELDSFAEVKGLRTDDIINGVCFDGRIGQGYNNPSFGYGGYCFPKDTKQLRANFDAASVPQELMGAIVRSNAVRKHFIVQRISQGLLGFNGCVGVYRLAMKSGSDNFRESAVWDIMKELRDLGHRVVIYEPTLESYDGTFKGYEVMSDLDSFKGECDVIIANRRDVELDSVADKVYTRDVFNNN